MIKKAWLKISTKHNVVPYYKCLKDKSSGLIVIWKTNQNSFLKILFLISIAQKINPYLQYLILKGNESKKKKNNIL